MDEEKIFLEAVTIDSPDRRTAFLDEACGGDAQLRRSVEALLRHHNDAGSFLDNPLEAFVATIAKGEFDAVDDDVCETSLDFLEASDKAGCIGTLAHYEVIELVGRGGMGLVLKAFDPKLNRVVAIKVMAPELAANSMAVQRFLREARAAAAVSHDHVVTIHAIHDGHRPPFIVMEFVEGQSLQEKIDHTGALELAVVLRIGMQTARGLAAAHEQGLVHRDIKPANILLENGVERVKLTDFGLARAADDVSVTQTGQIAGTPQFMSPEQAQGHVLDARSDLFSLGSVLYTMSAGQPPFRADSALAMLRRVTDDDPRPICEVNSDFPDWLEAIIFKLLAKDPAERFQSAAEVADLMSQHLAHLQHPATASLPQRIALPKSAGQFRERKPIADQSAGFAWPLRQQRLWVAVGIGVLASALGLLLLGTIIHVVTDRRKPPIRIPLNRASVSGPLGMKFVAIPVGTFWMGTPVNDVNHLAPDAAWFFTDFVPRRRAAETPRHEVTISKPFEMSAHEVTAGQFRQFIEATGHRTTAGQNGEGYGWRSGEWREGSAFNWQNPGFEQTDDHPVCNVSWEDAVAFCRWLSEKEGATYRLPTEAEWEYACRAGTTTLFSTGDDPNGLQGTANLADATLRRDQPGISWAVDWEDGFAATAPVGSFKPNAFGLYDMHGNAWEWCQDVYDDQWYETSPEADPLRRGSGRHVFRGGGFDNWPGFLRSADRYSSHSETIFTDWAGFRVVREVSGEQRQDIDNPP